MTMSKLHAFLVFLALLAEVCFVQGKELSPEKASKLRIFVKGLSACWKNVGMAVTLVKDGHTLFAEGFGYRDLEKNLSLENNTRVSLGTLTMGFTSTLVADAVSKGQLKWDQPLREVLGKDFRLQDDFRTQKANMRDLLSHKLGMPTYDGISMAASDISREDLCMKKLQHFPVNYDFRSTYEYSTYPYVLAGYVTERLRGKTWEDDVTDTLFKTLGMSDTRVAPQLGPSDWENTANSYFRNNGEFVKMPEVDRLPMINKLCPFGCIFSTSLDMAKWMKFHLSGGKDEQGKQIVPKKSLSELYKPTSANPRIRIAPPVFPVEDVWQTYGLGFVGGRYRGYQKVFHEGVYSSFNCRMTLLPDVSIGVWVCTNGPGGRFGNFPVMLVSQFAMDLLLDEDPWLNVSTACSFPLPWLQIPTGGQKGANGTATTQQRPNTDYVGVYEHWGFGNFTVYVKDDSLRYKFGLLMRGLLKPSETRDTFYMTLDHPFTRQNFNPTYPRGFPVNFTESDRSDGHVDEVKVPFLEFAFPPVFKKGWEGKEDTGTNGAIPACKACLTAALLAVITTAFYLQ